MLDVDSPESPDPEPFTPAESVIDNDSLESPHLEPRNHTILISSDDYGDHGIVIINDEDGDDDVFLD